MAAPDVVATYLKAWNEPDREARLRLLELSWAEQGIYLDSLTDPAQGREALAAVIDGFQRRAQGQALVCTSEIDEHHGQFRFTWAIQRSDGGFALEGVDFGELAEDGRVRRITGFFGLSPPSTLGRQ